MIYLEFNETVTHYEDGPVRQISRAHAVELNVNTIHEAAQLFQAFEAGCKFVGQGDLELTSIGTAKRRGVTYSRWSGL